MAENFVTGIVTRVDKESKIGYVWTVGVVREREFELLGDLSGVKVSPTKC